MIREEHLEVYDLTLTAKAPVFVGSGKSYVKKEYVFLDPRYARVPDAQVVLMDEAKFFPMLLERGLVDKYERFMLGTQPDLYRFLTAECGFRLGDISAASRCVISAADALDGEHSLKEIHAFVRNGSGRAYVPGSSVKGALRTVILTDMILRENAVHAVPQDKRRGIPEGEYLNTLALKRDREGRAADDAVNCFLRGVSISDSAPVDDGCMMLAGKIDAGIDGKTHKINLCRECIRPGTKLHFKLTLDQSVLKGRVTAQRLTAAIQAFDRFYADTYLSRFTPPSGMARVSYDNALLLGGGAGFFSKTLTYPYLGQHAGLAASINVLDRAFSRHRHQDDAGGGISPRTVKYASCGGRLYPYGLCEVNIT